MKFKLKRIKCFRQLTGKVHFKGILPGLTDGIAVWGSGASLEISERIHRRAAKMIYKLPKNTPEDKALESLHWKSIECLYKKGVACLTHQIHNNRGANILSELIQQQTLSRSTKDTA